MAEITLTNLRKTLFQTVDKVLTTGEPVVIRRKGRRLVLREEPELRELTPKERWRRYMSLQPRDLGPDMSFEEIEAALAEAKTWDEELELDR